MLVLADTNSILRHGEGVDGLSPFGVRERMDWMLPSTPQGSACLGVQHILLDLFLLFWCFFLSELDCIAGLESLGTWIESTAVDELYLDMFLFWIFYERWVWAGLRARTWVGCSIFSEAFGGIASASECVLGYMIGMAILGYHLPRLCCGISGPCFDL